MASAARETPAASQVHQESPPSTRTPRLEAALVSGALFAANALSYLLNVVAARVLVPEAYGTLGSLLAVVVVGAVPAMGMQTVAALHIAQLRAGGTAVGGGAGGTVAGERAMLRTGLSGAAVIGAAALLCAPLLSGLLHLPSWWPAVWLGCALAPLTMLGVFHGILQGRQRFGMLALLVGIEGVAKTGGALAGLLVLRSASGTLAGLAAGCAGSVLIGWWLCGRRQPAASGGGLGREVVHATQALLGLVLLVNLDIVLARHHLSGVQAGDYAIGVIITKIAYWLPQAVAVIVLPRFVDPEHRRRLVPVALGVIALLDVWVVLATVLSGDTVIGLIGGAEYGAHVRAVWVFALLGSLLALVQLLLYARIASADRWSSTAVWLAVGAEILLVSVWFKDSVSEVSGAALASVGLLVLAGLVIEYRSSRCT